MFDGNVIEIEGYSRRKWVILSVTSWDIEYGSTDADEPGFYAFGGMWYGDNALSIRSYGKILPLDGTEKVIGAVTDYSLATLKKMVD